MCCLSLYPIQQSVLKSDLLFCSCFLPRSFTHQMIWWLQECRSMHIPTHPHTHTFGRASAASDRAAVGHSSGERLNLHLPLLLQLVRGRGASSLWAGIKVFFFFLLLLSQSLRQRETFSFYHMPACGASGNMIAAVADKWPNGLIGQRRWKCKKWYDIMFFFLNIKISTVKLNCKLHTNRMIQ